MKRILTVSFAVALMSTAYAQELKVFSCGIGSPGIDEPQLMVEGIAANGKYICGGVDLGEGIFVADVETGEVKWTVPEGIDSEGAELRGIDNFGCAIGYSGSFGITYTFATDAVNLLENPGTKSIIGESLTNDGSLLVGSISNSGAQAAYSKDGKAWTALPMPSEEDVLKVLKKMPDASSAKKVSGDGKVILGYIGNFQIPCLWVMNDEGVYVPDLFPVRFLKLTLEDWYDDAKPLTGLSAFYLSLSNDGRYVCFLGMTPSDELDYMEVPVVYDTLTKTIKVYSEIQEIDLGNIGLYPIAISNDGTFIGTIGKPFFGSLGSFIMKAGETQAEMFVDAFPEYYKRYGEADMYGYNVCAGISADARYITGYIFYSENFNDPNIPAYYESYVLDRGEGTVAVDGVAVDKVSSEAIYSIDGRRQSVMTQGINIVRNSDGTVKKVLKK